MREAKNVGMRENLKGIFSRYKLLFLVVAVVAVSGCIVPGGDVFAGMFSPQRPSTTEGSADLITTQNTNIIPNPPISAENGFTVSFEVKNNDENEEVKNVKVTQYDSGLCKSGKTDSGGGGSGEDSEIVKMLDSRRLISLKVDCKGDGKEIETMFLEDSVEKEITVCGTKAKYKASITDYKITLSRTYIGIIEDLKTDKFGETGKEIINSYLEYMKFTTGAGKTWDCIAGIYGDEEKYKNACFLKYVNTKFSLISEPEYKERAECIGKAKDKCYVSEEACGKAVEKENKICTDKCSGKSGAELTACNNQCEKYRYEIQQAEAAPCNPYIESLKEYRIVTEGTYDGVCCAYDIVSQDIDTSSSTTSTTAAGAKTYYPLQTELMEWGFTAPKNSEIGSMPRTCGIKYKINYDFSAKTQTDVTVISKSKMEEMQRSGQEPSANPQQSVGVGPIKVLFDFGAKQPIKSGDIMPVFITVEDRGAGIYGNVLAGKLKLKFPSNFEKVVCDKFTSKGAGEYANTAEIPMIKKSSPQMRCSFKMPSVTDMKTFYISATLDYTYKLDDEINVAVNPTLVR
ncbi:MAG: hypothetical protein WA139_00385 [Candidatus Aenigmatarchaeota archaeon]